MSLSYALFMICCCFGVPLVVMIFCNYKIYKTVKTSKKRVSNTYPVQMSMLKDQNGSKPVKKTNVLGIRRESNQQRCIGNLNTKSEGQSDVNKKHRALSSTIKTRASPPKRPVVNKANPEEIRLAIMLVTIVIVFFICWFPYCISMILSIVVPGKVHRIFHMSTLLIGYFNSCCNPIIYGLLNKRFSDGYKKLYCFWR